MGSIVSDNGSLSFFGGGYGHITEHWLFTRDQHLEYILEAVVQDE